MDIKVKLYKPFVISLNKLKEKYGETFERINGFHNENLNFTDFIDNFIDANTVADVTIDANSNSSTKDIRTLMSDMVKPHTKLLAYNKIFYEITKKYGVSIAEKWLESDYSGESYLHDASSGTFFSYCYAYDLEQIAEKGLFFIDRFKTGAPKHLTTFNDHVLEFVSYVSNRSSGACGLPSYLVYSYYFWYNDVKNNFYLKDPEYYREQCFQKFVYDLNQPYLRITECAFTNISIMDRNYLSELFGSKKFPNGEYIIDHIDEIIEHQKKFMKVVSDIRSQTFMTFPVLTYALLYQDEKFVDEEFARWCSDHNCKWYDSNFYIGSDVASLSSCCRMVNDTSKLDAFINSIGGTSLSVGSLKVNTINLRRIALDVNRDMDKFFEFLNDRVDLCIKVLDVVRGIIQRNVEKGLLPNFKHNLIEFDKCYSTIGITSVYEAVKEFGYIGSDEFGNKFYTEEGIEFVSKVLDKINKIKDSYNLGYSINLEAIPAEQANIKLCAKDNKMYSNKDIENFYIYSNQWIPLVEKCTIAEKVKVGSILDIKCGGGQISHINIQAPFANKEQAWSMLNYIAKSGIIYFAYNIKTSVCENEHGFFGSICPVCNLPVKDVYSRVVGYLSPVSSWSKERKKEFSERTWFDLNDN